MTTFGDIRSTLHRRPGPRTWNQLCEALDLYADAEPLEEVVLPYCQELLERWPPRHPRTVPWPWKRALQLGHPLPHLRLCTQLARCRHRLLHDPHLDDADDPDPRALAPHLKVSEGTRQIGDFEYLRGHLCPGSSGNEHAWKHLCWVIEEYDDRAPLHEVISWCSRALQRWPSQVPHEAPERWKERLGPRHIPPLLALCDHLSLWKHHLGPHTIAALAASPHVEGLAHLDLGLNDLGDRGARALANSPHLARLESLELWDNGIGDDGARALAQTQTIDWLAVLNLGGNHIGPDGAAALAGSFLLLSRLHHLDLAFNKIGPRGAAALAASEHARSLTHLNLRWCAIGDGGARALAHSPHLGRLHHLDLENNHIGPEGAQALAQSPHLVSMRHLLLGNNPLGQRGAQALAQSPYLPEHIREQWR